MSPTAQSRRKTLAQEIEQTNTQQLTNGTKRRELLTELIRQRALLLRSACLSMVADAEPELHPDPIDQASTEFEQELAMQVRTRTFDKLRRIEQVLRLMRTSGYGRCRRCHEEIPYERLKVQPDALFCVPCLIVVERKGAGN
jgi:RNA polymerase-binding transcription factor DksA